MSTAQKIIKYLALALAFFLIVNIISGILMGLNELASALGLRKSNNNKTGYLEEITTDLVNSDIATLKIDIDYADLKIKRGETFKAESNNKDILCTQNNNQIIIKEENHNWMSNKESSELVIYIPEDMIFDAVKIETGAGEINIADLITKELSFEIGAGKVEIEKITVLDKAKIDGGAGKVEILSGEIHNLDLDMGVGELELTSKLTGNNDIDAGVGRLEINLTDGLDNYHLKVSKGLGSITVDGKETEDGKEYGNGESYIKVNGGIGAIEIR